MTVHTTEGQYLAALSAGAGKPPPARAVRARPPAIVAEPRPRRAAGAERDRRVRGRTRDGQAIEVSASGRPRATSAARASRELTGAGLHPPARARTTDAIRSTTASGPRALESISMASSAFRSGAAARVESRSSRASDLCPRLREVDGPAGGLQLGHAATGAFIRGGGQEELRAGGREHHRADVPPLDDHPAGWRRCRRWIPSSAARTSGSADTREAPSESRGLRMAVLTSSPAANTRFTAPSSRNDRSSPSASPATPGPSSQAMPAFTGAKRHHPVNRARVQERVAELRRQHARRRRLAGPSRPVDGDNQTGGTARPGASSAVLAEARRKLGRELSCPGGATWRARGAPLRSRRSSDPEGSTRPGRRPGRPRGRGNPRTRCTASGR